MGIFSGIKDAVKDFSGIFSDVAGIAAPALSFVGGMQQRALQEDTFEESMAFNSAEAAKNREFSAAEAEANRSWQHYMSGSAYQRARWDMEAAGFNPMLAYSQGGAFSGGGAQGSGSAAQAPGAPHYENYLSGAVGTAMQAKLIDAQVQKAQAEARLVNVEADNKSASPSDNLEDEHGNIRLPSYVVQEIASKAELNREQLKVVEPTIRKILNEVSMIAQNTQKYVHETRLIIEERLNAIAQRGVINAEERHIIADAVLKELAQPEARNMARSQSSPWKMHVTPYLKDIFTGASSAAAAGVALRPRTVNIYRSK